MIFSKSYENYSIIRTKLSAQSKFDSELGSELEANERTEEKIIADYQYYAELKKSTPYDNQERKKPNIDGFLYANSPTSFAFKPCSTSFSSCSST